MQSVQSWIERTFAFGGATAERVLISVAMLAGLILLRWLVLVVAQRLVGDVRLRYRWRKGTGYAAALVGVLSLALIWRDAIRAAATFLGLLSAGLTVALRDPLTNIVGWAFILWRRPFAVGDRVEVGSFRGDVVDVRLFQFTLLEIGNWVDADQSTGRVMHVPNGEVFRSGVANYGQGMAYIWNELPVHLTFESDWEEAKDLLQTIADRHDADVSVQAAQALRSRSQPFAIVYKNLTPTVYVRVEHTGVLLTVRYLCQPRRRRSSEAEIWEDVLVTFAQHPSIELAYPTQRLYARWAEADMGSVESPNAVATVRHSTSAPGHKSEEDDA